MKILQSIVAACAALFATPLPGMASLANIAEGRHDNCRLPKRTDGALGRNLLVKPGSNSDHVVVSTASDSPYGVTTDEGAAAEAVVNVQALAGSKGTILVTNDATGAIVFDDLLVPAAGGKVKKIAAGAGNYYVVARAVSGASADGDTIEAIPLGVWKTQ